MERVGVAALKDNLSHYLRAAEGGIEIEITDRDRPIARIVPIQSGAPLTIRRARKPLAEVRDRVYPAGGWSRSSLEVLLEERQGR